MIYLESSKEKKNIDLSMFCDRRKEMQMKKGRS